MDRYEIAAICDRRMGGDATPRDVMAVADDFCRWCETGLLPEELVSPIPDYTEDRNCL